MTKMLASVTGVEEAEIAIAGGVDIIDLKDPKAGALGAVTTDIIRQTVSFVAGRRAASAVCGDLPMEPETIRAKAEEIAATGVDLRQDRLLPIRKRRGLRGGAGAACRANETDCRPVRGSSAGFRIAAGLRQDGFHGAMVDTADKARAGCSIICRPSTFPLSSIAPNRSG